MSGLMSTFGDGGLTPFAMLVGLVIAVASGIVGGWIGGIVVGGKALGNGLAGMMGMIYGPIPVIPAASIGILVLYYLN